MYGIYANMWGMLIVNVTIYGSTMDPIGSIWALPSGVDMWVSHWNIFFYYPSVYDLYTGTIIILR